MQRTRAPQRILIIDLIARPVGCFEEVSFGAIELKSKRLHCNIEVRGLRGTDDRDILVGAACDPCQRDMTCAHPAPRGDLTDPAGDLAIDLIAIESLEGVVSRARCSGVACQEAARKWAESGYGDACVAAVRKHLPLFLPIEQVVLALHVDE